MKPETAAKKLEVLLAATPAEFQARELRREEVAALQASPPEWLVTLRREGPHPRPVVAQRLGVSNSGLARGGNGHSAFRHSAFRRTMYRVCLIWLFSTTHAGRFAKSANRAAAKSLS